LGARVRSIAVFLAVFSALPVALVFPFAGVLLWAWIAFMNPHREAFGVAFDFPFNFYIAIATLGAWVISQEPKRLPAQALPVLIIAFAILFSITTYFAFDYEMSYERFDKHIRTFVLLLIVMSLAFSRLRIQAFLWVIALSIGYFAVKGGGFILATGAVGARIYGPSGSMIADNNDLSLAIVMSIPILHYLRVTSANPVIKAACLFVMVMSVVAVIGTNSRGGFIGLAAVSLGFIMFARPKFGAMLVPVAIAVGVWNYAPSSWFERIGTIKSYETDESAANRFAAWQTSTNLALDRPFIGGGFSAIESEKVDFRYNKTDWRASEAAQEKSRNRAAHSIFFQVLGDHGFLGLAIWLSMIGAGVFNILRVMTASRGHPELVWAKLLARALLISLMGYIAAGAFLSMAYYDVFLCMLALTVPLREIVSRAAQLTPASDDATEGSLVPVLQTAKAD
jgi:putative inorganic carbon (hco3(-)) transporter